MWLYWLGLRDILIPDPLKAAGTQMSSERQENMLIEILKAILFGVVEGITEWLPISSTGHMILLNEFVTLDVSPEFWEVFLVVIQLGAILAVVLLFWNKIFPFHAGQKARKYGVIRKDVFVMWFKVLAACVPAMIYGILLDDLVEPYLYNACLLYTSPSPRDRVISRMPSSA